MLVLLWSNQLWNLFIWFSLESDGLIPGESLKLLLCFLSYFYSILAISWEYCFCGRQRKVNLFPQWLRLLQPRTKKEKNRFVSIIKKTHLTHFTECHSPFSSVLSVQHSLVYYIAVDFFFHSRDGSILFSMGITEYNIPKMIHICREFFFHHADVRHAIIFVTSFKWNE